MCIHREKKRTQGQKDHLKAKDKSLSENKGYKHLDLATCKIVKKFISIIQAICSILL